ncbi:MAG: peptidylprolyl isomerase [Nostocaceae cyanobacterium]|nr:peptidylprolyl isomerase [Nostocaceae cyanobacterium]
MQKSVEETTFTAVASPEDEANQEARNPEIHPVTDADIIAYLRQNAKIAEFATQAERQALILACCEQFQIQVSDDEWQAAGDAFRQDNKLLGIQETMTWLNQQRISVEEWSEGIRVALLEQKLKEHLFGASIDGTYMSDRDKYQRVALSQILVTDLGTAWKVVQMLREGHASFCALALQYSKGKQSQNNGGFVGVRYLVELLPEIADAIKEAKEGEIIGPIQTKLGYHVLRVEKWFPSELTPEVREQIMNALFEMWLHNLKKSQPENNS